jgi:hypothetical protein
MMYVIECMSKGHLAGGSYAAMVVQDICHDFPNVFIALAIIEAYEPCRSLPVMGEGCEHLTYSSSLCGLVIAGLSEQNQSLRFVKHV